MIPRLIFRTVPERTDPQVEAWWQHAQHLHPGWEFITYRDPLDPADWSTGDLWPMALAPAQLADMIRLDALARHGGIYLDSDVELYRPLTPLLGVEAFAGWEDPGSVPNAVLGAEPGHPAIRLALQRIRELVAWPVERFTTAQRIWHAGNLTRVLVGRPDVLLLPPGSFYPYHYSEKHRRSDDLRTSNPWAFGAHHWHHSWKDA